jgi:heme exporter protein A
MPGAAAEAQGLWKYFGDYPALRDVTLTVSRGSTLALIGRNGAGKTTLLRVFAGLSRAGRGTVLLDGVYPREASARSTLGWLGHGISLYEDLSAFENLRLFAELYGVVQPKHVAQAWIERVNMQHASGGLIREFSRGMRQRIAIARAFLHGPQLLLLDEPFTSLDDRAIALLQSLMREANAQGRTVIMSTHQLREALELATDVALLARGKLVHQGPRTPQMVNEPGWLYAQFPDA